MVRSLFANRSNAVEIPCSLSWFTYGADFRAKGPSFSGGLVQHHREPGWTTRCIAAEQAEGRADGYWQGAVAHPLGRTRTAERESDFHRLPKNCLRSASVWGCSLVVRQLLLRNITERDGWPRPRIYQGRAEQQSAERSVRPSGTAVGVDWLHSSCHRLRALGSTSRPHTVNLTRSPP